MAMPNLMLEVKGYGEYLNSVYGMGRWKAVYRGHLLADHGGDLDGFHSQVSIMPQEKIGVVVFVIGDHAAPLYNVISYNLYERLLSMKETPWSARRLVERLNSKKADTEARAKAGADRVPDTKPSHVLADYVAQYENEAYGVLKIGLSGEKLQFDFHKLAFPLTHYHYDRFDTPEDEYYGKFSVNFGTNPQGDVDKAIVSMDQAPVVFTRRPDTVTPERLKTFVGEYLYPDKSIFKVIYTENEGLSCIVAGAPQIKLFAYKGLKFRSEQYPDQILEFVVENGAVKAAKITAPSGEMILPRKMP